MSYLVKLKIKEQVSRSAGLSHKACFGYVGRRYAGRHSAQQPQSSKGNKWSIVCGLKPVYRLLFLTLLIHHTSYIIFAPTVQAQGVYKNQYIYAHTFESGLTTGKFKSPNENCVKFVSFEGTTRPQSTTTTNTTTTWVRTPSGDADKVIIVPTTTTTNVSAETTGTTTTDDSFDGGSYARCFSFSDIENPTHGRIKLTNQFLVGSNPKIRGIYFEAGHVNMDGTFVTNSNSQYRLIVKNSANTELFNSGVLDNAALYNKFFIPFPASLNTAAWAGQNITFEIRAWTNSPTGSKVFRFDDIALIGTTSCSPANLALGNLVWQDTNADGIADAAEPKLSNVCMNLYADDGDGVFEPQTTASFDESKDAFIGQTTTDASGKYSFTGLAAGDYFVSVCGGANFKTGGALKGYRPTPVAAVAGDSDQDNKDHGITRTSYKVQGVASDKITLTLNGEPTTDGDDANTNSTIDFGFQAITNPLSLGNLVWKESIAEDGLYASGEEIFEYVALNLYKDSDASNTYSTGDELIDQSKTNASGLYFFEDLEPDNYIVTIPASNFQKYIGPLRGYRVSKGIVTVLDPDNNTNNDNNGELSGYRVVSKAITLAAGTEPTNDGDTDANSNLTVDFGFSRDPNAPCEELTYYVTNEGFARAFDKDVLVKTINGFPIPPTPPSAVTLNDGSYLIRLTNGTFYGTYLTNAGGAKYSFYSLPESGGTATTFPILTPTVPLVISKIYDIVRTPTNTYLISIGYNSNQNDKIVEMSATGTVIRVVDMGATTLNLHNNALYVTSGAGVHIISYPGLVYLSQVSGSLGTSAIGHSAQKDNFIYYSRTGGTAVVNTTTNAIVSTAGDTGMGSISNAIASSGGVPLYPSTNSMFFENNARISAYDGATDGAGTFYLRLISKYPAAAWNNTDQNILTVSYNAYTNPSGTLYKLCNSAGVLPPPPPVDLGGKMSLGNLIWKDDNNDGIKDAAETPIAGVRVELYVDDNGDGLFSSSKDVRVAEDTTDVSGLYLFKGLPADKYFVKIMSQNFNGGQALNKYINSTGTTLSSSDLNDKDHGTDTQKAAEFGVISSLIALAEGTEPINDGDTDANSNLTIDFGFYLPPSNLCLGNLIWKDLNNNVVFDAGEPPIAGVTVQLFADTDGDAMFTPGTDLQVGTNQVTDAAGLYKFCGLAAGDYFVVIPKTNWGAGTPLDKFVNSTTFTGANFDVDNDDSGVEEMAGPDGYDEINFGVVSTRVTLAQNTEPDVAVDGDDKNGNMTVDFGFFQPVNLGNLVWSDANRDSSKDTFETPIANVAVDLFIDNGDGVFDPLVDNFYFQQLTNATGLYFFDRLAAGKFFVRVSANNFDPTAGVLREFKASIGSVTGNSDLNDKDHGIDLSNTAVDGVLSSVVDLAVGTEPALAVDSDGTDGNLTIDFGFIPKPPCNIFTDNFGSGANPGATLAAGITNLTYVAGVPAASETYAISNATPIHPGGAWHAGLPDHTGNGYMMVVNAGTLPSEIYRKTVTGLLPNTTYNVSAYIGNLVLPSVPATDEPNVTFNIEAPVGTVIATKSTGIIPKSATFTWVKSAFTFTTGAGITSVDFVLKNNTAGSYGNDFVVDDIVFEASYNADAVSAVCGGANPQINLTSISIGDKYAYGTSTTGFSYATATSFSGSSVNIPNLPNTTATYIIRIYNGADDCYKDKEVSVTSTNCPCTVISALTVTPSPTSVSTNGTSTLTATGTGVLAVTTTYSWAASAGTFASATVSPATWTAPATPGTYNFTVTANNANGTGVCTATATATISVVSPCTPLLGLTASATPASLTTGNASALAVSGTGIISGTTYTWAGTGAFTATTQNPSTGTLATEGGYTYTVTATNANGTGVCTATATTSLTVSTAAPTCTVPAFTATTVQGTCTGATTNADAKLMISGVTNGDKVAYSTGATYSGAATYSTATQISALSPAGTVVATLANPASTQQYTIRVYNTANTCYTDQTVTLNNKTCTVVCVPRCGTITITTNP